MEILDQHGAPTAIIAVVSSLPVTWLSLGLFCVIALLYLATTFDSAAYTISSGASRDLGATGHPSRGHRSFWALLSPCCPSR